jgi:hypothetical protein
MRRIFVCLLALSACNDHHLSPANSHADLSPDLTTSGGCHIDAPGAPFVFHVLNSGHAPYRLTYGCGATLPITVDTTAGPQPISPGPADFCEVDCTAVYAGQENNGCSDCGPGYGAALDPSQTVDIHWDRRVFTAFMADPSCTGHAAGNGCALGTLTGSDVRSGTLTVCSGGSPTAGTGYCASSDEFTVPFTFDPSADSTTISVP